MSCFEEFKKIVKERLKNAPEITMESNLKELGLDSLDLLEAVIDVEEVLGVKFEDDELVTFVTVGDVVKCAEGEK